MSEKFNWLHLSDFHFGKQDYEQKYSSTKLIEHLSEKVQQGQKPDFVFITGDVANSGKKSEYEKFKNLIISPLVDLFGENYLDNIFIVPGNHDLDRNKNDGFSKEKFGRPDSPHFYPTQESLNGRNMLVERFKNFCDDIPTGNAVDFSFETGTFAIERTVSQKTVGIVGINTAWLCDGDRDKESLTPGLPLVRDALASLKNSSVKIVLGHHPLDWLHPAHRSAVQAVLAQHKAIYLHGHMHAEGFSSLTNGPSEFCAIQAGAAWQCPEGGKWKNGFMWGRFDGDAESISLQPYHWSFDNQCWTLDGTRFHEDSRLSDWWTFDAPKTRNVINKKTKAKIESLVGWDIKDLNVLERHTKKLSIEDCIAYFDGATPTWATALSTSIPRREIVGKLSGNYRSETTMPLVCVLLAAGCEGKTTALFQASLEILQNDPNKKIIYRTNHTRLFDGEELLESFKSHNNWLVVIDEADQIAKDVLRFIESGFSGYEGRIDFLFASRDSDWRSSGASQLEWSFRSKFKEIVLKDLSRPDAEKIVQAWAEFGARGLGEELAALPPGERADKLRHHARKEAKGNADAFFGALLVSRHGNDLLQHAESMLQRLASVELDCGKSLKDVLGYIAAMHAEGFDKLSFAALAFLLEMSVPKLQSEVIRQLGKEAAATSTSTNIFTRHKYIAIALVEVLETNFNEDISQYFLDLALSETRRAKFENVINLAFWQYEMAEQLFSSGKSRLAIDITKSLYEEDSSNFYLLTKLASFYRKEGNAAEAIKLFRNFDQPPFHRGFYFEWGVSEGIQDHRLENAILASYALSDESENSSITVENAKMYLNGLSTCCDRLHISFADPIFTKAEAACYSISNILTKNKSNNDGNKDLSHFLKDVAKKRKKLYGRVEAIKIIQDMVGSLRKYGPSSEVTSAIDSKNMTFLSLDRIVRNVESLGEKT
ncbi:Hypothetical protein mma_0799 [Janthinobacterium sp. Marseille]|nr:metallophosphoesterase [Janthinobacterium sp. Marseille]ABR91643.1 Hypothetical protein mma_0799 [Janthinobacterium sp. Marseille]